MIRTKTPKLIFGLFVIIVSLFILYLTIIELRENTSYPVVSSKGKIDVSKVDFGTGKLIGLEGQYEFYWGLLLYPIDFMDSSKAKLSGYIQLPGLWNGYKLEGNELGGSGYATFRVHIKVSDEDFYSIKVKEFDCAYRLWVNGNYVECGSVGTNKNDEKPSWKRNEVIFFSKDKTVELILQVSNFYHRKGGPEDLMLFGKSSSVESFKNKQIAITNFLLGLFFIMFIYNFGLYVYRKNEKSYLYFSIICLLIVFRESTTGEKVIYDIIPSINWWAMIRIEYISYTILIPFFYMFMRVIYPDEFSKLYSKIVLSIAILVSIIVLFTPVRIFSYTPIFYQSIVALTAILILIGLVKAVKNMRTNSVFMLSGYSILFLISINDILYYDKILNTTFLMPFGLFIIVFVNALTLSKRFSDSFSTIEVLTKELSESNVELEKKVVLRTNEVLLQKQEIEKQAISLQETNKRIVELGKFKESMTHMIVHDLKNPLNTIMNISIMEDVPQKDSLIHEAGREMNNLVMNMLDVYKYENTSMILNKELQDIGELINGALNDVSFLGKLRNIVFFVNTIENTKIAVDKNIIHRVLVNLLTNAIKFSPLKGKVEVNVLLDTKGFVKISITDNGTGIRPERQKTIFDRYQTQTPNDSLILSTGLGLNFCKMAVEAHGGTIGVESIEMQGSTFSVVLPFEGHGNKNYTGLQLELNPNLEIEILSNEDIDAILPYVHELKGFEVYQVSDIFRTLHKINDKDNNNLKRWIGRVMDAVMLCKQDVYSELINISKK